jgi:hypothetical protein
MKSLIEVAFVVAASSTMWANPVTWYLSNVTFNDGGRAVGSFVYDADTKTVSSINIQTTPGATTVSGASAIAGGNYSVLIPSSAGAPDLVFTSGSTLGQTFRRLALLIPNTLTNSGGAIQVTQNSLEGFCNTPACPGFLAGTTRSITSGLLVAASSASPRTWYFTGTFDDGGQAIGSFVYDATSNAYSSVDIATTGGNTFAANRYQNVIASNSTASQIVFVAQPPANAGTRALVMSPSPALANTDMSVTSVGTAAETTCASAACATLTAGGRILTNFTLTTTRPANYTKIVSQVADGGVWQTGLLITNLTDNPASYAITFSQDDGTPFPFPGIGSYQAATVPARGVSFLTSTGAPALVQGWAKVDGGNNFSVTSLFTQKAANAGGDQQGSAIADAQGTTSISIPYDYIGAVVGLALTNPSQSPVMVLAVGYDETGRILMTDSSVILPANGHTAFAFTGKPGYSALVNHRGLLRLFAIQGGAPPYTGINALLLKFLPNNSFATVGVANQ